MARSKRSHLKWIVPLLLAGLVWLSHPLWMMALGRYLVRAEAPFQADVAVALAGDYSGRRILRAAELVRDGYTKQVLVSGPEGFYGANEAELAIPFAVRQGCPESWFTALAHKSHSTREEASAIVPELRRRQVRRFLLVTSNYHTRRAARLFASAAPDLAFRVIPAEDAIFHPDRWWRTREGQKCFVLEWMKTITGWFGI